MRIDSLSSRPLGIPDSLRPECALIDGQLDALGKRRLKRKDSRPWSDLGSRAEQYAA